MIFYKIRSKKNPLLYRKADGSWNKSGKVYDTLGKLRTLLTYKLGSYHQSERDEPGEWEIVEFEVKEVAVKKVYEVIDPKKLLEFLALPPGK